MALALNTALARVVAVQIDSRQDLLGGRPYPGVGPYERLAGLIHFAFDPDNPYNARIVDLGKAPTNRTGAVAASAGFMVLRPKQPCPGGCVGLLEVSNRGGKAALAYFNGGSDPVDAADLGDGLLMRLGLTLIWVGWQFDVPRRPDLLRLEVPRASDGGRAIRGLVRSDWTVDRATRTLSLGHRDHIAYPAADPQDPRNSLTRRDARLATRHVVPRGQWSFTADRRHITLAGGFTPGHIYELVYVAQDPAVVGLGLAAVRDVMAYARNAPDSPFHVDLGLAFGVSQSGRFLRHFLYQGFNTDEQGRKVFDGLFIHAAGAGRGSFNHRFAQPSRDAHRYSAFFYPTDLFPFTGRSQCDPLTQEVDGLFAHSHRPGHLPRVIQTNTGYDYWGRAASLIHTSVDGRTDVDPLPFERIYHLAGAQHFVGAFPPTEPLPGAALPAYRGNPLDFRGNLRALLVRLVDWIRDARDPPQSRFPRLEDGTLVAVGAVPFPQLPGIETPRVAHEAYRLDYGPRWGQGIIDLQPPRLGAAFPTRVSAVDGLGNELGGIRNVALRAPLATYYPWALRSGYPAGPEELVDFLGTFIPLASQPRRAVGDPRPSIPECYPDLDRYLAKARQAAQALVSKGFLLTEDLPRVEDRARALARFVAPQWAAAPRGPGARAPCARENGAAGSPRPGETGRSAERPAL
jgi:hypothetical protein